MTNVRMVPGKTVYWHGVYFLQEESERRIEEREG